MSSIKRAIKAIGGVTALARKVGVSHQAVQQWAQAGRVPAERALAIERATKGAVTRYELRPDLYPRERAA